MTKTRKTLSLSEFLRLVLKSLALAKSKQPGSANVKLLEDPKKLHRTFYRIKVKYAAHFPVLDELHFIEAGAYPYSSELTEALDRLQMAGAIVRENPSYQKFSPTLLTDTDSVVVQRRQELVGTDSKKKAALEDLISDLESALTP